MTASDAILLRLVEKLEADHQAMVRHARQGVYVRVGILGLVIAYMSFIYSQFTWLSGDRVVKMAGEEARAQIPVLKQQLVSFAKDAAPEAGAKLREALLHMPTHASKGLVDLINDETGKHIPEFERNLNNATTGTLLEHITVVKARNSKAPAQEQLAELRKTIRRDFSGHLMAATDLLHDQFHREIDKINTYLVRLQTAGDLAPRERIEREMIEAWMTLVRHHRVTDPKVSSDSAEFPGLFPSGEKKK